MIVTLFLHHLFFINLLLVNFSMIGCLRACIRFKQKPFKWLVLAGLLFLRVTHLFASHRLKSALFEYCKTWAEWGHVLSSPLPQDF